MVMPKPRSLSSSLCIHFDSFLLPVRLPVRKDAFRRANRMARQSSTTSISTITASTPPNIHQNHTGKPESPRFSWELEASPSNSEEVESSEVWEVAEEVEEVVREEVSDETVVSSSAGAV